MRTQLYVLIACEESQAECEAFRALGHIAFSCDIQPCRPKGHPEWHIHGDVTPLLDGATTFRVQSGDEITVPGWDLIVAHPPCTYLCKVSSVHMRDAATYKVLFNGEIQLVNYRRYQKLREARQFFFKCLNTTAAPYVAVENPLPMALAELPHPSCFASPHWFGVKYTKKTLYWLRNLPPLLSTVTHPHPRSFVRQSRGKYRSRTFPQHAAALAAQWSSYILDDLNRQKC